MAATKGINLNPGADRTLVAAATNAAMANVPKDLSLMFARQTENYRLTMESIGKSYGTAIAAVGKVAGEAVKENMHKREMYARGANSESPSTRNFFKTRVMKLKNGEKELRKMAWFSDERVEKRVELDNLRKDLFARIEQQEKDIDVNIEAISVKDFDEKLTGINNLTLARSINLMGQKIEDGSQKGVYSELYENNEGKVGWHTYGPKTDAKGNNILISKINPDGTIVYADKENDASFVDEKNISRLLKKRDITTQTAINAMKNQYITAGVNGTTHAGDEVSITRDFSNVINRDNIGQLLDDGSGNDLSFIEKLNTPFTSLSMKAYASMKGITGLNDTDEVEGVSQGDFDISNEQGKNYAKNLANHVLLRDAMDPKSDNFNFEATKEALATELAQDSIKKNKIKFEEWEQSQVLSNKIDQNNLRTSELNIKIKENQLYKQQNPTPEPVDYFPSASNKGGSGIIFTGQGENFNPSKVALNKIRENIVNGVGFKLGNVADVKPDGKGGWTVDLYRTLTKDEQNPNVDGELWRKGKSVLRGVDKYKNTNDLIKNYLPGDFSAFPPEQYLSDKEKKAMELIKEAKNVNK